MAYWNNEKLKHRLSQEGLITDESGKSAYNEGRVKHCAYEMAVGKSHLISGSGKPVEVTLANPGDSMTIPPGQFALLMTEEVISIPLDAIGFISIRARMKFKGLVNVSGFHVDPGFRGRLKFSVYNAGARNIPLARGDVIFMLWYADLIAPTEKESNGMNQDYLKITSKDRENMDGEVASPSQLVKDIARLKRELSDEYAAGHRTLSEALSSLQSQVAMYTKALGALLAILLGIVLTQLLTGDGRERTGTPITVHQSFPAAAVLHEADRAPQENIRAPEELDQEPDQASPVDQGLAPNDSTHEAPQEQP